MLTAGSVTLLASDIPLGRCFRGDVVVDRVTTVTEGASRTLLVVRRVVRHPPIRVGLHEVCTPDTVGHVPLRPEGVVIVSNLGEIALLPFRSVDERDVVELERNQWIRLR